jgi:hypothetical protein
MQVQQGWEVLGNRYYRLVRCVARDFQSQLKK